MTRPTVRALLAAVALAALTACGGTDGQEAAGGGGTSPSPGASPGTGTVDPSQRFPDVETAELRRETDGTFTLEVTISSPYDTPERYADGWRVLDPDGNELGRHDLAHDHADEQPFTRTQSGLVIPDGVPEVRVEGRDLENGYGGTTVVVAVPPEE
ncbi:hypothetical protein [uncultured Phycicoccus sp.]|uniref:hypothetical protein n=1 Tax=uncultured Phycicoccus sp. TaxID=661422 RepID=UPI00261C6B79|nr:hypothetical protein [uncultured Phycicoccus sp.]